MSEILFQYEKVAPATWAYLSSLLTIGLYFKFNRVWSVRNLDLLLLILLAPGLLLVHHGQRTQKQALAQRVEQAAAPALGVTEPATSQPDQPPQEDSNDTAYQDMLQAGQRFERLGYLWLLGTHLLLLIRLLVDPTMVRRPLLEPNLSVGGLLFIGIALLVFLMANVAISRPTADDLQGPLRAHQLMARNANQPDQDSFVQHGPGYALLFLLPSLPTAIDPNVDRGPLSEKEMIRREWYYLPADRHVPERVEAEFLGTTRDGHVRLGLGDDRELVVRIDQLGPEDRRLVQRLRVYTALAKLMAILSHCAIVIGLMAVGYWHFNNLAMGVGAATLYLLLPYTSQLTGRVDHALPGALLVWAILCYRRPLAAGLLVGLATGVVYYPIFLLPLWISFYWQRGLWRFVGGVCFMLLLMAVVLAFSAPDLATMGEYLQGMFGLRAPQMEGLRGIWRLGWPPVFRYPILAAFIAMCATFAIWPAQKNLGSLLSGSAAVMVGTQFWHGYGGGLYIAWHLPLLLLTIFRPNLEDRIAVTVLGEGWFRKRRPVVDRAA